MTGAAKPLVDEAIITTGCSAVTDQACSAAVWPRRLADVL